MNTAIRMIRADLLKLYRQRALMAWSGLLLVGAQILFYAFGAVRHAGDPAHYAAAGGARGLANALMLVSYLGGVAAVMIGTSAGGGDAAAGVLRDLVSSGRSRLALFAARLPAALLVTLLFAVPALAAASVGAVLLAPAGGTPATGTLAMSSLAMLVSLAVTAVLAVGLSSLLSSRSIAIGLLLCWNLALSRVLEHATSFGALRELLPNAAGERLVPVSAGGVYTVPMSVATAVAVLLGWVIAACAAGAWRTAHRDV
jgi:ABC-type transport system involved in multi-copper enzyme maturation permease subunit